MVTVTGIRKIQIAVAMLTALTTAVANEATPASAEMRQSLDDAWWTGPILAASASTLPKGHFLIEPYVYDVISQGRFDEDGDRHSGADAHSFGSQTYLLYGVADRFTVGLIPRFGFNDVSGGQDSSGIRVGDLTVQGQYRFTQFREGSRVPTISLVMQETFPTGKYDRLGSRPSDAMGSGAYSTTVALYSQYYFWMPNGRILRTRLNLSQTFSGDASVQGVSVYGTDEGFRGDASPGDSFQVNSSWEYSLTRNWVLAFDLFYQHDNRTRVNGITTVGDDPPLSVQESLGPSDQFGVAPAIEYNWSSTVGVIVGARWIASGRNAGAHITPVAAINIVY